MMVSRNEVDLRLIKEENTPKGYDIDYYVGDVADEDLADKVVHKKYKNGDSRYFNQ